MRECTDQNSLDALEYILSNLRYCTSSDLEEGAIEAADVTLNQWKLNPADTILTGVAERGKTCGSSAYVRAIETRLPRSWKDSIHTTFDSAFRHRNEKRNLLLVDDFVGSGEKISTRIDRLLSNPKTKDYQIHVISFAGMDSGLTAIADKINNRLHSHLILEKCFKNVTPAEKLSAFYSSIDSFEKNIFDQPGKYSLGYAHSETAFYLEGFNIPNNNFPILWWEEYANKSERITLFRRR